MRRRSFLQFTMSLLMTAAFSPTALARKPKAATAFKGAACNHLDAAYLNPLNLGWFHTAYNPSYCLTALPNLNAQTRWTMHLFNQIPNPKDVQQLAANNPNYDRWWVVGDNEADLADTSPKRTKQLVCAQIDMVLDGDPDAKFCLAMGSQVNAFGGESAVPYVVKVWDRLDAYYRNEIRAFLVNWYAQMVVPGDTSKVFETDMLTKFCETQNAGLLKLDGWKKNQLVWLGEIGMSKTDWNAGQPQLLTYPDAVQAALNGVCGRWAWYGFENINGYHCLYDSGLTPLGRAFAEAGKA